MKRLILIISISILLFSQNSVFAQGCMSGGDEGVKVVGFFQPQYESYLYGDDNNGNSLNENRFTINRARIGFIGSIPYDFGYYLFVETSPFSNNSPKLLDAFISYKRFAPYATFVIGQFKSPFGLELNTPCHKLHTIYRSEVTSQLASPLRDLGFMVLGGSDTTFYKYQFGLMNGKGMGLTDDNTNKDIVGRLTLNPFVNNDDINLNIGGSFRFGQRATDQGDKDDVVTRFGGEIEFEYKNFLLQGEYITSTYEGQNTIIQPIYGGCGGVIGHDTLQPGTYKRGGFWIQAMYMTKWNIQPVIKYELYDPDLDIAVSNYSTIDDFIKDENINMNYLKGALQTSIITFGVNYFLNDWTRIQLNYLYKIEESSSDISYLYFEESNDAIVLQIQVQF